jgi:hypothetical protein
MTPPPTSIDGTDITGATIDGQEVQEITIDGQTVFIATTPSEVLDDWADNQFTSNRESFDTTPYQFASQDTNFNAVGTRQPWTITNASPFVTNKQLDIRDLDVCETNLSPDPATLSKAVWEFRIASTSGRNGPSLALWRENGDNFWQLFSRVSGGNARLDKIQNGNFSTVIDTGQSFPSSSPFKVRVTRDSAGFWEVFLDGNLVGSATDTFAPTANNMQWRYSGPNSGRIDSLAYYDGG